jgi:hypothetical protein
VDETGDALTFIGGVYVDDLTVIEITGGSLTVALSDEGIYTIITDFAGEDESGKKFPDLRFEFTGALFFEDRTMPEVEFTDIAASGDYSAKGIPSFYFDGPETWTGSYEAYDDEDGQYYAFENFEGEPWTYYCNFKDGGIFIDGATPVGEDSSGEFEAFFRAFLLDDEYIYLMDADVDFPVRYFKTTGVLDFSAYFVDEDGMRVTAWIGMVALPKSSVEWDGSCFSDLYENLKYQLTPPVAPTSKITGKSVLHNKNAPRFKAGHSTVAANIIKVDKSKMTKIPKAQLKVMDVKSFHPSPKKNK